MRAHVQPGVFLATAAVLSAAWLWLRPSTPTPQLAAPSPAARTTRTAAIPAGIHVDRALLQRYAGRYEVEGFVVKVAVDGERLVVEVDGGPAAGLRASTETKFFFEDFPGELTFDAGAPAPGFVADLANGRYRAKRVRD